MIDNIMKIEDFKKIMEQKKLERDKLRLCIIEKQESELSTFIKIVLTIPKDKDTIMECVLARRLFFTAFLRDKDSDENKKFREMVDKAYGKAKELFGDNIIEGNWEEK